MSFAAALLIAAVWLGNTSAFSTVSDDQVPRILAHRGVHQIYAGEDRNAQTCSANPVVPMSHDYIANTIRSMQAAFAYGADVVELDVHLTRDDVFAVYHDWRLECQTDGQGVTHKRAFAELAALDIGYGITSDGTAFPLRGQGQRIPSLEAVFNAGLSGQYLINFKSNRASEGAALLQRLADADVRAQVYGVYGGAPPTRAVLAATQMRGFDRPGLKTCLLRYAALGWSGYVPQDCRTGLIAVPMNMGPFLWGWPHRFTARMKAVGSDVVLWGPYDGSGFSSGIDDAETLARVPAQFDGFIWTNRIEVIGPILRN